MYKAILLDDEYLALKWMTEDINWPLLDIRVAGIAADGAEGMELIEKWRPDLIITDLRMPGMDGLELIAAVAEKNIRTNFIILSGYGEFEYAQKAIHYGVQEYLLKPVSAEQLEETVKRVLKHIDTPKQKKEDLTNIETISGGQHKKIIEQIMVCIKETPLEDLTVYRIAEKVGFNPNYLSTLFKRCCGKRLIECITIARIEKAKELLQDRKLEIQHISLMAGYHDPKYFARIFKRVTGFLPGQYRKQ
jgi:YesN/AraC family two-component response regulator